MQKYINKTTNQYPVTEQQIRLDNPNTSFPALFTPPEEYALVFPAPKPEYDPISQSVIEIDPVLTNKGNYEQQWEVINLDPEIVAQNQANALQEKIKAFDSALTQHLDSVAQSKKYDNRITCMVRAGFPGPFQKEAQLFAIWCDDCNYFAYDLLDKVQQGLEPIPESPQAFIDMLPVLEW